VGTQQEAANGGFAVEEGLIFTERYESYLSMLLGDDNRR